MQVLGSRWTISTWRLLTGAAPSSLWGSERMTCVVSSLRRHGLAALLLETPPGIPSRSLPGAPSSKPSIMIDFSSPNIAKNFHVGNLRSTLIGRFIKTMKQSTGHTVHSLNYLGDWGTQIAIITTHWPKVGLILRKEVKTRLLFTLVLGNLIPWIQKSDIRVNLSSY